LNRFAILFLLEQDESVPVDREADFASPPSIEELPALFLARDGKVPLN
jgi:hypothetical protein